MAAAEESRGLLKPILIGVATTVLSTILLYHLGLDHSRSDSAPRQEPRTEYTSEAFRERPPYQTDTTVQALATTCQTLAGTCPLFTPVLRGIPCYCITAYGGSVGGIAQ